MLSFARGTPQAIPPARSRRPATHPHARNPIRLAIALVLVAAALPQADAAPRGKRSPKPATPPPPKSSRASSDADLSDALRKIAESRPFASARTSIQVLDADSGQSVFSLEPDLLLKPASNMKIVTSATAVGLLGPEFRFKTSFYATAPPDVSGVVHGDLYIKGGGNPGLVGEEWWGIARHLRTLGMTRVEGSVVGDDSYFDDVRRGPKWPSPVVDNPYNAPISALSCFYSSVAITVTPTAPGRAPDVYLEPYPSYFKVMNRAVTAPGAMDLRVGRQWDGEQNIIHVEGRIPPGAPVTTYKCVEEPTLYAVTTFKDALAAVGITVTGPPRVGIVPHGSNFLWAHESKPLADLIQDMNKESNNFMAESILRAIGAETAGAPGTAEKGAAAVRRYFETLGISSTGLVQVDGSGLSSDNRVSANMLARLLLATRNDFHAAPEFMASLPIGGVDGTLDHRMTSSSATRKIRAKTGFINGVSSLSGYAWNDAGRLFVFSIVVNAAGEGLGDVIHAADRFCSALVSAPIPPELEETPPPAAQGG
ncbi:MAG TPA: D-alanyl-D-alanine carboxypeptidase/D-alanyl-D-alanine-endopeptidase [Verrucomicrobiae bacterium]|nr:D-alanyl-D-alanine carboxypeptidase/D-alanyl-D-alanine-endopeptidase [Verrucomicrobiae bacterium]